MDYSSDFILADCLESTKEAEQVAASTTINDERRNRGDMTKSKLYLQYSPNKTCFTIDNVLSLKECSNIIARSEEAGYDAALLNIGRGLEINAPDRRLSDRCIIDDQKFTNLLFKRIEKFLPRFHTDSNAGLKWELAGLNERLRILRYGEGHFFAPHRDGSYSMSRTHRSMLTLMIYLNSGDGVDFVGGATNFPSQQAYVPRHGEILVFDHKLLHEGEILKSGTKFCIRTDVMYNRVTYSYD